MNITSAERRVVVGVGVICAVLLLAKVERFFTGDRETRREPVPLLGPGTEAPDFTLRSSEGGEVSLWSFQGKSMAVVFVSPACGHCERLQQQIASLGEGAQQRLLIVSTGGLEDARALKERHGFTASILADSLGLVSSLYRVSRMPAVYRIAEDGLVSEVAAGMLESWRVIHKATTGG